MLARTPSHAGDMDSLSLTPSRKDLSTKNTTSLRKSTSDGAMRTRSSLCLHPRRTSTPDEEWCSLVDGLHEAFALSSKISPNHPSAACLQGRDVRKLVGVLSDYSNWEPDAYTRTPVVVGEGFAAMLLCWSPGAESPVHAHSDRDTGVQSNCFMLILEGELTETTYDPDTIAQAAAEVRGPGHTHQLVAGSTGYINDSYGVHKVANQTDRRAMSLHVYAPGWSAVSLYEEATDAGGAPIDIDAWGDF